jgi:hypothetical protein
VITFVAMLAGAPALERGIALGLFSQDPAFRYGELLAEIRDAGATHVSVAWVAWQETIHSNEIGPVPGWTATDEQIVESIRTAKALGLHVTAFPILRIVHLKHPTEWRGRIAPADEDRWWESYDRFILGALDLAVRGGADRMTIGSELLSREGERERWKELIGRVRVRAPGVSVLYSANWDHYELVSFWDLVDDVGVTAYFELTRDLDASTADLARSWSLVRPSIERFSRRIGRRILFTEVGYPSLDGGAAWPWDETRRAPIDLEEQRRAYEAFVVAWGGAPELGGVYFWNWFGFGGPDDASYTPRNKPAASVIRGWYHPSFERR